MKQLSLEFPSFLRLLVDFPSTTSSSSSCRGKIFYLASQQEMTRYSITNSFFLKQPKADSSSHDIPPLSDLLLFSFKKRYTTCWVTHQNTHTQGIGDLPQRTCFVALATTRKRLNIILFLFYFIYHSPIIIIIIVSCCRRDSCAHKRIKKRCLYDSVIMWGTRRFPFSSNNFGCFFEYFSFLPASRSHTLL